MMGEERRRAVISGYAKYLELSPEHDEKPMQDIKVLGEIYLKDTDGNAWGDDWNDCPASANAGPPYDVPSFEIRKDDLIIIVRREPRGEQ